MPMKPNLLVLLLLFFVQKGFSQNYYLEDRWPNLRFRLPVGMFPAPDSSKRIFVLEQQGRIKVFKDSGNVGSNDTSTFLDLSGAVPAGIVVGNEYGLLGLAFHPQYRQNGFVFVNYTRKNPLTTIVSRFKVRPDDPNKLDPASEKILIQIPQPYTNHNGGSLLFGDDGYLYIATGDGGSGGDPGNRAQNKGVLLGKLLRIDVNVPTEDSLYLIPPDNPYAVNNQSYKREIYAHGLRNPWKVTKDPESSTIWIGEVGQGAWEEVDTARLGANYGWKVMEGNHAYSACNNCDTSNYEPPIYEYGHSRGISITGGYVYRGEELYKQKGTYFFGDYVTRRIWGLRKNDQGTFVLDSLLTGTMGISSFGLDNEKELYAIGFGATNGRLQRIRCGPPTPTVTSSAPGVCLGDTLVLSAPVGVNLAGYKWSTGDTTRTIKIYEPGAYTFTVKTRNTFGCWSYASTPITVSVNFPPTQPAIGNDTICVGDTARFNLPSGLTYVWSGGFSGNPFSTNNSGNFWVVAKDNLGCKSDTARFQVAQFPTPATPVLTNIGDTLFTEPVEGATYQWFYSGSYWQTTDVPKIAGEFEGVYHVSIVSEDGCESALSNSVILTGKLADRKSEIRLSPNPTRQYVDLNVKNLPANGPIRVSVFNSQGQAVWTGNLNSDTNEINHRFDLSNYRSGIYLIQIQSGSIQKMERIMKID